jgi:serine/threonine-protein kinase RIO1
MLVAHKTMVNERHVLHGDLSPNNIIIHEGKGYFIDFDHAKVVQRGIAVEKHGIVS